MSTLAEFLLARITEDEQLARENRRGPEWYASDRKRHPMDDDEWEIIGGGKTIADIDHEHGGYFAAQHIARWDPARVLRECQAKRAQIEMAQQTPHRVVEDCWYTCPAATEDMDGGECCDDYRQGAPCDCGRDKHVERLLSALALPYAEHPDYRPEWRAS